MPRKYSSALAGATQTLLWATAKTILNWSAFVSTTERGRVRDGHGFGFLVLRPRPKSKTVRRQPETVADRPGIARRVPRITCRNLEGPSRAPESKVEPSFRTTRIYVRTVSGSRIDSGSVPMVSRPSNPRYCDLALNFSSHSRESRCPSAICSLVIYSLIVSLISFASDTARASPDAELKFTHM